MSRSEEGMSGTAVLGVSEAVDTVPASEREAIVEGLHELNGHIGANAALVASIDEAVDRIAEGLTGQCHERGLLQGAKPDEPRPDLCSQIRHNVQIMDERVLETGNRLRTIQDFLGEMEQRLFGSATALMEMELEPHKAQGAQE